MRKIKLIYSNNNNVKTMFEDSFAHIVEMALNSNNANEFKIILKKYMEDQLADLHTSENVRRDAIIHILRLIENDNTSIYELSVGESIQVMTITYLWLMLSGKDTCNINTDLYIDLYQQFVLSISDIDKKLQRLNIKRYMDRWRSGLNNEIISVRELNKARIIDRLIVRIESYHSPQSKYNFDSGMTYEHKRELVKKWWDSRNFQLAMAAKNPSAINNYLGGSLSEQTMHILNLAKKKGMPFFVTPYYLSLLAVNREYDDAAIRSYILYSSSLVDTYGSIKAWEKEDIIEQGKPNAAGWLLPEGHNIHRRYPEVAILIPDSMGRACGGLCASCQRMYDFQSERFNFNLEELKVKEGWATNLDRLMLYFEKDTQLRDILITGGDAFMSRNGTLRNILESVYHMADRKRKSNLDRPNGEKYAEIQRVRLGSRLLAYLPMRIDDELINILREFKIKASAIGIKQFVIQTHFQTPLEVTPEAKRAIEAILSAGWTITNQLVFTVAASRLGHTVKLRQTLNRVGVVCYYTFTVKGFKENSEVFAPNARSLQEQQEEKKFGLMSDELQRDLYDIITSEKPSGYKIEKFLKNNNMLFAATDRNALNLPAIGKSMTFKVIGITKEGCRILKFEHDKSRHHSPIVDNMHNVYIVENKSIASYLRQLEMMHEDAKEYDSIWGYNDGVTEPIFELYKYPKNNFSITDKITNMKI